MDYKLYLLNSIINTDLEPYVADEDKLDIAIEFAKSEIARRLNVTTITIPATYDMSVVEGAVWYLSRIGTEGEIENSEGDITRKFEALPSWLKRIVPYVGVLKVAGTK